MNEFEEKKRKLLGPIYFEAGAALFDCQSFEYGIAYYLFLSSRRGVIGLDPTRCAAILDDEEKKTAGQLINLLKAHVQVSDSIEKGLVEALKARNKLIHRYLIENVERFPVLEEQERVVAEIRALRSAVQRSHKLLQPFVEHLARTIDGVDIGELGDHAKQQFVKDAKEQLSVNVTPNKVLHWDAQRQRAGELIG